MTSLLHPRAIARIKAAFDTCALVARTVHARRQIVRKLRPKAAAPKAAAAPVKAVPVPAKAIQAATPPKAPPAKAAAPRTTMIYEGGTVRIVTES
jgi:hypothetical protein